MTYAQIDFLRLRFCLLLYAVVSLLSSDILNWPRNIPAKYSVISLNLLTALWEGVDPS